MDSSDVIDDSSDVINDSLTENSFDISPISADKHVTTGMYGRFLEF